jgi:exodeoxyribonuclease-3
MASEAVRIATVNANGIRAAYRKGMAGWLENCKADVVAIQEVRASTTDVERLIDAGWHVLHEAAEASGRAGVALLSRFPAQNVRTGLEGDGCESTGRWLEADFTIRGIDVTVVSAYVHSGEVGTVRQTQKFAFLEAMTIRLPRLAAEHPIAAVVGDLNVGHRTLDIKNWRGNVKRSGFLPEERAYFDRFFGAEDDPAYNTGGGLGWIDVGRKLSGEVPGPYSWWSNRGRAFDNDTGWRIDYQMATPLLAAAAVSYRVDRADSYDERWSDHAPILVDYAL